MSLKRFSQHVANLFPVPARTVLVALGLFISLAALAGLLLLLSPGPVPVTAAPAATDHALDLSGVTLAITGTTTTVARTNGDSPSTYGDSLTFRATVKRVDTGTALTSGTVTFKDNGVNITGCVGESLNTSGQASCTTSAFTSGTHTISAHYSGSGNFALSIGILSPDQIVNKAPLDDFDLDCPGSSEYGEEVTCTATASSSMSPTPTGVVSFYDGGTDIGMDALDGSGEATVTTSALTAGDHKIKAIYHGDDIYIADEDEEDLTVDKATPTVEVTGPDSSYYGESVTFEATVESDVGTPTGKVVFSGWGDDDFEATLSDGKASFTPTEPHDVSDPSTFDITAEYKGDDNFKDGAKGTKSHKVTKADTKTELTSPLDESDYGQEVQFIASVSADPQGAEMPTGDVTFKADGTEISGCENVSLGSPATCRTSDLSVGTHDITAKYNGDTNFNVSTSETITHTVNGAGSETSLESSVNPSAFGQSVTFTATVEAAGAGSGIPTGTVTFKDGGAAIPACPAPVPLTSSATCTTSDLSTGEHEITAEYSGDTNFEPSEDSLRQTVNIIATTTALSGPSSSAVGDSVTFTATVSETLSGDPVADGNVTFWDGTTELGTEPLVAGVATYNTSSLSAGLHLIKAVYNGTPNFTKSTSPRLYHTVGAVGSTTTLTKSPTGSTVYGQSVDFTATVAGTGGPPTGQVTFKDGAATIGTETLVGGVATLTKSNLAVGTHPITAVYDGDVNFAGSTSNQVDHVVNKASTTTAITSDAPDSSVVGQPVKVDFTVTGSTPTGNVTVTVSGDTASCTGSVAAGTCTLIPTTAGAKTLTATYAGDDNFNVSSDTESHQVNPANTTTTVTTSPNPSVLGQEVTITADVTANSPSTATPNEGTVQFSYNGGTSIGSASVVNGSASVNTSSMPVGAHTITADYSSGANFNDSSDSSTHNVRETPADLSVTKMDSPDPVNAGRKLTYVINVTNNEAEIVSVMLVDTLPPGVSFVSATPSQGSCSGTGTVTCDLGNLAGGGSATVTIVVNVPITTPAGTILRNTAQVNDAQSATAETTVYRLPSQSGDCNGDEAVNLADVWAIVRDIFDPTFQGTTGCDANQDERVDAGDVPSTVLIMLNSPEAGGLGGDLGTVVEEGPALALPEQVPSVPSGLVTLPVSFAANGHSITSLAFSVDYDETWLGLDPTDRDGNGIPDAVVFSLPGDFTTSVTFDGDDADGEVDVFIGDISPPLTSLSDGPIAFMILNVDNSPGETQSAVRFSLDPAASFGDTSGQSVPGTATPMGRYPYQIYLPVLKR